MSSGEALPHDASVLVTTLRWEHVGPWGEDGSLSFLALLPHKPKGPPPYSLRVIMCWPPSAVNPEPMYAQQAGRQAGRKTDRRHGGGRAGRRCSQLVVSEVRERARVIWKRSHSYPELCLCIHFWFWWRRLILLWCHYHKYVFTGCCSSIGTR